MKFIVVWLILSTVVLLFGCVNALRQRDYAKLYHIVPREERNDFGRLVSWIAQHDGNITLRTGDTIYWEETAYFRTYSNDVFILLSFPPRFNEMRSSIYWVAGTLHRKNNGVGVSLFGIPNSRGPATYDFPQFKFHPVQSQNDGIFGVNFNDNRPALLKQQERHIKDQHIEYRQRAIELNSHPEFDVFIFNRLYGCPGTQMFTFLDSTRSVVFIQLRMPDAPGLGGLLFAKEDPPVLRQGSFIVDAELAAKGKRRPVNMVPKPPQPERRKP